MNLRLVMPIFLLLVGACDDPVVELGQEDPASVNPSANDHSGETKREDKRPQSQSSEKDAPEETANEAVEKQKDKSIVDGQPNGTPPGSQGAGRRGGSIHPNHEGQGTPPPPRRSNEAIPYGGTAESRDSAIRGAQRTFELTAKAVISPCPTGKSAMESPQLTDKNKDDMKIMLEGRQSIKRELTPLSNGVRTESRTKNEQVAKAIISHVTDMKNWLRLVQDSPPADPLYKDVVQFNPKIVKNYQEIPDGMRTEYLGNSPDVVSIIHAHAELVSQYLQGGNPVSSPCHKVQ